MNLLLVMPRRNTNFRWNVHASHVSNSRIWTKDYPLQAPAVPAKEPMEMSFQHSWRRVWVKDWRNTFGTRRWFTATPPIKIHRKRPDGVTWMQCQESPFPSLLIVTITADTLKVTVTCGTRALSEPNSIWHLSGKPLQPLFKHDLPFFVTVIIDKLCVSFHISMGCKNDTTLFCLWSTNDT